MAFGYENTLSTAVSTLPTAMSDEEYLRTVEQPLFENWLLEHRDRHLAAHEAALVHGLSPGGEDDLPTSRMLIDRVLKRMAARERIDLHGPAAEAAGNDDYVGFLANDLEYMGTTVGGRHFRLRQVGRQLPTLATWLPIGPATYCGHALDLDHALPEVIREAVVGRRLGELVATGIRELDERTITAVLTPDECTPGYWPAATETRIAFEPDLVELGP